MIGGGALQWGEAAWAHSIESHIWPRAIAVAEVLWSNPKCRIITDVVQARIEGLAAKFYQQDIMIGAPYLGYQF